MISRNKRISVIHTDIVWTLNSIKYKPLSDREIMQPVHAEVTSSNIWILRRVLAIKSQINFLMFLVARNKISHSFFCVSVYTIKKYRLWHNKTTCYNLRRPVHPIRWPVKRTTHRFSMSKRSTIQCGPNPNKIRLGRKWSFPKVKKNGLT